MRALARVEARCLLRHPVFLVGVLLTAVIVVPSAGSDGQSKLFVLLGGGVLPLAAGTFIAANLAALRSRRDGTDELFGALPRRGISRTAAQLLAVAVAAPVALILLGAMFVALGAPDGLVVGFDGLRHVPAPVELAQGPLLVVFLGAAGIALARLAPSVVVAPLALVGLLALEVPVTVWQAARQPALAGSARPRHDRRARRVGSVHAGGHAAGLRPRARLRPRGDAAAPALSRLPDRGGRRGRPAPLQAPVTRARQAALLVRPTLRALPLARFGGCATAAAAVVWVLGSTGDGQTLLGLQCAAVALCVGAAAVVEDPAANTIAAVPPPLRFRRALRLAIGAAALALAWGTVLALGDIGAPWTGALTLQFLALAAAHLGARRHRCPTAPPWRDRRRARPSWSPASACPTGRSPRAPTPARLACCGSRSWPAASRASCWRRAIRPAGDRDPGDRSTRGRSVRGPCPEKADDDSCYSPTPIASTGRERSARRVGSARATSASSAEPPRIAASGPSGT